MKAVEGATLLSLCQAGDAAVEAGTAGVYKSDKKMAKGECRAGQARGREGGACVPAGIAQALLVRCQPSGLSLVLCCATV